MDSTLSMVNLNLGLYRLVPPTQHIESLFIKELNIPWYSYYTEFYT